MQKSIKLFTLVYLYRYNGKELNEDFGLNWLDYGARWYDPALGRWHGTDPLAEVAPGWTPYRYGFNNPLSFIDPTGLTEERAAHDGYGEISESASHSVEFQVGSDGVESRHKDHEGNVVAEIDDGDNSVYQHKANADGSAVTAYQIEKRQDKHGTSAGGTKIGEIPKQICIDECNGGVLEISSQSNLNSLTSNREVKDLVRSIDSISDEISAAHKRAEIFNGINDFGRKYEKSSREGIGTNMGNSMSAARNETDSVNNVKKRKKLIQRRDSIVKSINQ